ncbi:barstar family protein [Neobacillus massiliamazoniensis]|uniref:Uncharacterized protein n=1 Tax=Neobacillus massiliamazoniensis TaxID=1499688 RepID=A0A0U1P2Z5_9BACI|nr:barstar family protein [Neobacillus massiliamazoniensis]CRK84587.1 hypothetical protein BN000_04629 [Neobacillus massiliamazoniensis]
MNLNFPLIRTVNRLSVNKLIEILNVEKFYIIRLNGSNILDEITFFKGIVSQKIPLDPPLSGNVNYDSFTDSLWGGIEGLHSEKVAIIWSNFNKMLDKGLNDFLKISECICNIAEELIPENGAEYDVDLKIFLLGEGDNFPILY